MTRKDFIVNACTGCLSVAAIASAMTGCTATRYISGALGKDGLTLSKKEFLVKGSAYRSFIIVRNDALQFPICVYRLPGDKYTALWMKCSHQGNELQASGDVLQCPAHGSEFNNRGQVTSGPADVALRTFPVTVSNNELFIDLRKQS